MINQSKTRKHKKERTNWLLIFVLLLSIICIIGITVFACNYSYTLACKTKYSDENANISILLSTGLSIIGIAVAVWAALNITNAISRGDIENLNNTVYTLNKSVKYIKPYILNNRHIQSELFLVELTRYEKDPIINYLSTLFRKDIMFFSQIPFSDLTKIELKFSQVRSRHQSAYHYDPILISLANEGLSIIDNILTKEKVKVNCVESYLLYRQCEFQFFMGYCEENRLKGAKHFVCVSKKYSEIAKLLDVQFPNNYSSENFMYNKEIPFRTAYLANTIGEAYSKIVHYYIESKEELIEFKDCIASYADKAVNYCTLSINLLSNEQRTSTYYRNLGCALERKDNLANNYMQYKKIISTYRSAFCLIVDDYLSPIIYIRNTYYTLLSYYSKIIEYKLTNKGKWKLLNISQEFCGYHGDKYELTEYTYDMYQVSKIGITDFPRSLEMVVFHNLACCFFLILLDNGIILSEKFVRHDKNFFIEEIKDLSIKFQTLVQEKTLDSLMNEYINIANAVFSYYNRNNERVEYDDE